MIRTKFGEKLVDKGRITEDQLNQCIDLHLKNKDKRIGSIIRNLNFINDFDVAKIISEQVGWDLYDSEYVPNKEVLNKIGIDFALTNFVYPIQKDSRTTFVVATIDDTEITDTLTNDFGFENVEFVVGQERDLANAIDLLVLEEKRQIMLKKLANIQDPKDIEYLSNWVNDLIDTAIMCRSTDIHIEGTELATETRLRIDGSLQFNNCLNKEFIQGISNIIFSRCEDNPSEFFKIHDGRFSHKYFNREVDIRVSYVPSITGSSTALRLLDKGRASYSLHKLGYSDHNSTLIQQAINTPHGIILVTGPTGCGKSTTLYSILNQIKSVDKKIMTAEDPVEMTYSLITQLQVNEKQGLTYPVIVKSMLRHDPDIILIGEIRDEETAELAIKASLTGHQVFSTLHTNDPIGSILRLKGLKIDSALIADSVVSIISQRLVKKLCNHCKKEVLVKKEELDIRLQKYLKEKIQKVYEPVGCCKCINGYWERTVVAEVLLIDDYIREMIEEDKIVEIRKYIKAKEKYLTIYQDAQNLVEEGITSLIELENKLG